MFLTSPNCSAHFIVFCRILYRLLSLNSQSLSIVQLIRFRQTEESLNIVGEVLAKATSNKLEYGQNKVE